MMHLSVTTPMPAATSSPKIQASYGQAKTQPVEARIKPEGPRVPDGEIHPIGRAEDDDNGQGQ